jgi:hypothetical protein
VFCLHSSMTCSSSSNIAGCYIVLHRFEVPQLLLNFCSSARASSSRSVFYVDSSMT